MRWLLQRGSAGDGPPPLLTLGESSHDGPETRAGIAALPGGALSITVRAAREARDALDELQRLRNHLLTARARTAGAEMIEADARLTSDGEIALIHDADPRRTTDRGGQIADMRADELAGCDAGHCFTRIGQHPHPYRSLNIAVPRLADLVEWATMLNPDIILNIEIQNQPAAIDDDPTDRVVGRLVTELEAEEAEVTIASALGSSFNLETIDRVKALKPSIRSAYLCGPRSDLQATTVRARARGHDAIHPRHALVMDGDVARYLVNVIHGTGLEVNVWTVNGPQRMLKMAAAGVDGIITDDPGRLRDVSRRRPSDA